MRTHHVSCPSTRLPIVVANAAAVSLSGVDPEPDRQLLQRQRSVVSHLPSLAPHLPTYTGEQEEAACARKRTGTSSICSRTIEEYPNWAPESAATMMQAASVSARDTIMPGPMNAIKLHVNNRRWLGSSTAPGKAFLVSVPLCASSRVTLDGSMGTDLCIICAKMVCCCWSARCDVVNVIN